MFKQDISTTHRFDEAGTQAALNLLRRASESREVSIVDLMTLLRAHPDYVFGTVWVREDVTRVIEEDSDPGALSESTIQAAQEALRGYLFDNVIYPWDEALRDALRIAELVSPAPTKMDRGRTPGKARFAFRTSNE